jgi:UDP-glucose 4-epimerase
MRVFVTGAASRLAQALLPKLCAAPEIESVVGIDRRPALFSHRKFTHRVADIRVAELGSLMEACDGLVHLAFVVLRGKMSAAEMHAINVAGTQHVFQAALAAGVSKLIHLSSAAVYGWGEGLAETAALHPLAGFLYGRHKAEVERWMERVLPQAVRFRPHIILGPHCQPLLKSILRQPCYVLLPDPQPLLQCVHEDDVADAIVASLFRAVSGPFNLAAPGAYSVREVIRARHRLTLPLPLFLARSALYAAWRSSGFGGEPAWIDGIKQTLTIDCGRANNELGWQPHYDAEQTLKTS